MRNLDSFPKAFLRFRLDARLRFDAGTSED
jgi:hypothetical protein